MDVYGQSLGLFKVGQIFHPAPKRRIEHPTAFYHTQLRDSLCFGHTPYSADLYIKDNENLVLYNTMTGESRSFAGQFKDAPMPLVCFKVMDKFLVIGGVPMIQILNRHTLEVIWEGSPLKMMPNSFCCHHYNDELRLIICNNAKRAGLQVFGLPGMKRIESFPVPDHDRREAVNYCAISSDGKWMIALGDLTEFYVFDVSDGKYTLKKTIPCVGRGIEDGDGANMVCWDHSSRYFAIASEAGCCLVYGYPDKNGNTGLLYRFWHHNKQPPSQDAKVLKTSYEHRRHDSFSSDSEDEEELHPDNKISCLRWAPHPLSGEGEDDNEILVFLEGTRHIHIVDLKAKVKQVIVVPTDVQDLSGVCFSGTGRSLFVGYVRAENR